jgi:dUTP pyrophosphatase
LRRVVWLKLIVPVVKIKRLRGELPRYQSEQAAGIDLVAAIDQPITIAPLARAAVPTGIAIEIPAGFEGQLRPRSGRALEEGLTLLNSPGTVDGDYRGEIKVILINLGHAAIGIAPGDRIAQLVVSPVANAQIIEVEQLTPSRRGPGGFGHTGR